MPYSKQTIQDKDQPIPKQYVELSGVKVAYTDRGKGEPILLVHGIPTSSYLWRNVIRLLESDYRLIAPDLMGLGDTVTPIDHRYDMEAQAEKLLELTDHLKLDTFTLVCHDQGGAAAQLLAVNHPERIQRFIITNCVCYDNWPVPLVRAFMKILQFKQSKWIFQNRFFESLWGRSPVGMRLGVYDKKAFSNTAIAEYLKHTKNPDRFEQFRRFALSGDYKYTVQAAKKFGEFTRPTIIIWAGCDRWLNVSWGKRLYDDIAGSKEFEVIPFAGHFFQEEKPEVCARHIKSFMEKY